MNYWRDTHFLHFLRVCVYFERNICAFPDSSDVFDVLPSEGNIKAITFPSFSFIYSKYTSFKLLLLSSAAATA
jgi:hypothetical protein